MICAIQKESRKAIFQCVFLPRQVNLSLLLPFIKCDGSTMKHINKCIVLLDNSPPERINCRIRIVDHNFRDNITQKQIYRYSCTSSERLNIHRTIITGLVHQQLNEFADFIFSTGISQRGRITHCSFPFPSCNGVLKVRQRSKTSQSFAQDYNSPCNYVRPSARAQRYCF